MKTGKQRSNAACSFDASSNNGELNCNLSMMVPRKLGCPQFFLDANRVNARCKLSAMNQLEKWNADGMISLRFPEHAQGEAESGRDARRTQKARHFLIPFASITTEEERKLLSEIKRTI